LCLLGGIIGLALIWVGALIISNAFDFAIYMSWQNVSTGLLLAIVIGVIAGLFPAWQAARLHPVDAMRTGM
ncbi:MAG: ABC transporter permease, partial [Flavobacteriales bacterium]|nr:ABC transporter permease [Flavobacteriales bacterium]